MPSPNPSTVEPCDSPEQTSLAAARAFDSDVREAVVALQSALLQVGRRLVTGRDEGHLRALGFSSISHYAETRGIAPPARTHDLARVGEFLHELPNAEHAFLEGQLTLEAAAALCQVADRESEEQWLETAVAQTSGTFRKLVREEQVQRGERLATVSKLIEASDLDLLAFDDARAQVSRDEGRVVSEGEALGAISRHYLRDRDPKRRRTDPTRPRSSAPPRIVPGARSVPSLVARKVWRRDSARCRVPGCANVLWIELAHIEARADGGAPHAENLLCMCRTHNVLMETGELLVTGTASAPAFHHRDGSAFGGPSVGADEAPP